MIPVSRWGLVLSLLVVGCDEQTNLVSDDAGPAEVDGDTSGFDSGVVVGRGDGGLVLCNATPCACNNGIDDDGDGMTDGADPECSGAADDDEGSFGTGIPGDNRDPNCQDCFFDGNSGGGDDGCRYATTCLEEGTPPASGFPSCMTCEPQARCIAACERLVPNGCDCFGCCEVYRPDGTSTHILLSDGCSLERLDDPTHCSSCLPSDACRNPCGTCELCPGRSIDTLPATCADLDGGIPIASCDEAQRPCETSADCLEGDFCSLGCCIAALI